MTSYELSRQFWDYSFSNPDKIKPYHSAIYFFAIEHCNRLGWKKKFGFPTSMVLEATGIKSYSAYKRYFDELANWGFFNVIEYSKNQYSSNIIELSLKVKATTKALDKALQKHSAKQGKSTVSINKQLNKEQFNNEQRVYSDEVKNFTQSILKYFPISPKNIENWYKITDELTRIDKYNYDSILLIVETFTKDEFWAQNFQSYTKLRKKNKDDIKYVDYFKNNLIAKKNAENKSNNKKQGTTIAELQQVLSEKFD